MECIDKYDFKDCYSTVLLAWFTFGNYTIYADMFGDFSILDLIQARIM